MSTFKIDPSHSVVSFSIKHMMISKVRGSFEKLSGTLELDPTNIENSKIKAQIDAASINTGESQRDTHLKSDDFFDVEKFPTLDFKSTKVEKSGSTLQVMGDLRIRDITLPVTLKVEGPSPEMKDPWGNTKIAASASTQISRKDFGLTWNAALEAGGVLVGNEVSIELDLQFLKA